MDCYYVATNSGAAGQSAGFSFRTPRFINVVGVFVFAATSAVIQNYLNRFLCQLDLLSGDRERWLLKNIKTKGKKRRYPRKCVKLRKKFLLTFGFFFSNLFNYVPIIVVFVLWCAIPDKMTDQIGFAKWNERTLLVPEFFIPALFVKYISWYINSFVCYMWMFRKNKRRTLALRQRVQFQ